jgi:hypothetical protein
MVSESKDTCSTTSNTTTTTTTVAAIISTIIVMDIKSMICVLVVTFNIGFSVIPGRKFLEWKIFP